MTDPDDDLLQMDQASLLAAARTMRHLIRAHRDSSGHALCWYHPDLWAALPDTGPMPVVPDWPQFLRGCVQYRASLDTDLNGEPRTQKEFEP